MMFIGPLAIVFFLSGSIFLILLQRRWWRLDATDFERGMGGAWHSITTRRQCICAPAGTLLGLSITLLSIALVLSTDLPRWIVLAAICLTGISAVSAMTAYWFGVPRQLILPAFRSAEAFRTATRR